MTCIVAAVNKDGEVCMGCDSAGTSGADITIRQDKKMFSKGLFLIGYTGSYRTGQVLEFEWKPPTRQGTKDDMEYMVRKVVPSMTDILSEHETTIIKDSELEGNAILLVGYKSVIYQVGCDFQVGIRAKDGFSEFDKSYFDAIGSGGEVAIGSLYSTSSRKVSVHDRLRIALQASAMYTAFVEPPFYFESL